MKSKFTKIMAALVLLACFLVPMGLRGQTSVTFTAGIDTGETSVTKDGITVSMSTMSRTDNYRCYANTDMTVVSTVGNITQVAVTCTASENSNYGPGKFSVPSEQPGTYTYSGNIGTWSGDAAEMALHASSQVRMTEIVVTYGGVPTPTVAAPTFSPEGGTYSEAQTVTISCATEGVDLYYSTDGSNPDDESTPYSGPITVSETTTIKAIAYDGDDNTSVVASATYIIQEPVPMQTFSKTEGHNPVDGQTYLIVDLHSNRALTSANGSGSAPTAVEVTITNDQIFTDNADLQWTFEAVEGGYIIHPVSDNTKWLYSTDANNGVRVGTNEANVWTLDITDETNTDYHGFLNNATSRYLGVYNNQDWRAYTTIHANIKETQIALFVLGDAPVVPSITIENNNEIAYNATSSSFNFTLNNPIEGGSLAVAEEVEWISNAAIAGNTVTFTTTVNNNAAARHGVITLSYTYNRTTITKNVTVTQAGNPSVTMTIAEVRAQGTGDVVTIGTVTSCVGNTGYIQDATAAICVFGVELTVGDNIRVSGSLSDYHGLLEITNPEVTVLSSSNTVNPTVMTIAEINASTNQGWYIRIEEATVTAISGQNTTIAQGENTVVVRGISGVEYNVNDVLTLNGNIGCYNSVQIANPTDVTVQQNTNPVINAEDITLVYNATSGEIAYTIDNPVEGVTLTATSNAEWISDITVGAEVVTFTTTVNEDSEDRTAIITLSYIGATDKTVTVTQQHFVVDYATLPFAFDGGRADIATTNGLTHEGLDSDYPNSPKLKFNTTGDWVILHFDGKPGMLTFDIKGNPSSGVWAGTFKVQTSEDGVTYTDLEAYTDLTSTVQSEEFNNLDEDVRYIKWIYTEKGSGNVALGNIVLYEFGGGPVIETYDLTIEPFENLEIFTFIGGDENNPFEGAGTIQVTEGDQVMLSVSAEEGYVMQSLKVDGVEHVNDIDDDLTYTFNMPSHNVTISATAVADIPFEPATYTLVTTIESGKTYIIVGSKTIDEEISYFAMGEQKNNNRAGVAISVDGTTATVNSADVYEFVITALEEDGLYSIYDNRTPGYLYAAGPSNNYLRTEPELDTVGNGDWEISIDSVFHIVASHSGNRNVMQFNYNGGNTLFSCYNSANQSPVYLYVKEEATTEQTQTIALTAGFNWISSNVEITLDDLKAALVEALPGATSIKINSQSNGTTTYNGTRWRGQLNAMDLAQMYMVEVPTDCEMTLQGMPINVADHPVTIHSGNNWIAFPLSENMTLTNAFAGFVINGDKVTSQTNGTATYTGRWRGQLTTLEAGKGYMYESAATSDRTFTFPANAK